MSSITNILNPAAIKIFCIKFRSVINPLKWTFILVLFFGSTLSALAQNFLNGDFEMNDANFGADEINLSNLDYSGKMRYSYAFGTYGDMDIISSSTYNGPPQKGNWFVAFTGGGTDIISMELSSPLIAGKSYTISFWDRASGSYTPQPFQIGLSEVMDDFGTPLYTAPMPEFGVWTKRTFTFTAPGNWKYITVQLSGANNIGEWAQVDNFAFESANQITTGTINESSFCACSDLEVPFKSIGDFGEENVYTAQLSDAQGNFENHVDIGTLESNAHSGTIHAVIPCETAEGTHYRIRVVSSLPDVIGSDNERDITIKSGQKPVATISSNPSGPIHSGTLVIFTARITDPGSRQQYQWKINDNDVGGNSSVFSSSDLEDGDVVSLSYTADVPCSQSTTVESNAIVVSIIPEAAPAVYIIAEPGTTVDEDSQVIFTANPINGGTVPVYQWFINARNVGGDSPVFTTSSLKDGDVVTVKMVSNAPGLSRADATSNEIVMTVISPIEPPDLYDDADLLSENSNSKHYSSGNNLKKKLKLLTLKISKRFQGKRAGNLRGKKLSWKNLRRCSRF